MYSRGLLLVILLELFLAPRLGFAIKAGLIDNFEDGLVAAWREGNTSPNPPTNVSSGGPLGQNDNYLSASSSGMGLPGSRQVIFNELQWLGNYNAAGVVAIEFDVANFGTSNVHIRLGLQGGFPSASRYVSTQAAIIPADSFWRTIAFNLDNASFTLSEAGGPPQTLSQVLDDVTHLRILSQQSGPFWRGDAIQSVVGYDNILARDTVGIEGPTWSGLKQLYR